MKSVKYLLLLITVSFICTAQGCQEIIPTSCNDVEVFYGPLVETYGPASDGNQNQRDRFYLGNIYYKSSNTNFKAIRINFESSTIESVTSAPGVSTSSSNDELVIRGGGNTVLPSTGSGYEQLATLAWRVKYTDFDKPFGKQKFTYFDNSNLSFVGCPTSFIDPPSLYSFDNSRIEKPSVGYTPPAPIVYDDIRISNNGHPVYVCIQEGELQGQVESISDCTYKHLELSYEYMNRSENPLNMLRNDVLPHEIVKRILDINNGTYNGSTWWCDNGDLITSRYCKSCGSQNSCRKITFKM